MAKQSTVIQFAALVGKAPQQIYGSLRNGSFPSELVAYEAKASGGFQPMIMTDEALTWYSNKEQVRLAKAVVQLVYTADQLVIDLQEAGKKGLATQVANFIASKKA